MNPIGTPAFRLTKDCIWNSFRNSNKRHLILTGTRKSGKSTLLSELFPNPLPGITTWAEPGKAVYLKENSTGKTVQIGIYDNSIPGEGNKMLPCPEGFHELGIASLQRCAEMDSEWISIDEIGYLESGFPDYCDEVWRLMSRKRMIAAVRKQSLPFLEEMCHCEDVFFVDLDAPFGSLGCVIMASGLGRRFGGNKLKAEFKGKPLIQWTLDATEGIFARRIVVTRHREVEELCHRQGVDVIYHDLPYRSDTVRLGLQALAGEVEGCMFCPGDQPLLKRDTVAALALNAVNEKNCIWRAAYEETSGAPVLFPKQMFSELLSLPEGKGGRFLLKKYPEQIRRVSVRDRYELMDIDSPEDLDFLTGL